MPNWCENELSIRGKDSDVKAFSKKVRTEKTAFDFNKIKPYPKEYEKQDALARAWEKKADAYAKELGKESWYKLDDKQQNALTKKIGKKPSDGYNQGGYEWCRTNWGTKWNANCNPYAGGDESLMYFDTAWSPPTPIVLEASKQFPKLKFTLKFWEGGAGFWGTFSCHAGQVTCNSEYKYSGRKGG